MPVSGYRKSSYRATTRKRGAKCSIRSWLSGLCSLLPTSIQQSQFPDNGGTSQNAIFEISWCRGLTLLNGFLYTKASDHPTFLLLSTHAYVLYEVHGPSTEGAEARKLQGARRVNRELYNLNR
uniref:Uncharacterized protein n=1 Tax=Setaria italica TaxID=4555 RepID=K3XN87_SETIT